MNVCNSAVRRFTTQAIFTTELLARYPKGALKVSPTCVFVPERSLTRCAPLLSVIRYVPGTKIPYPPVDPKFKELCSKFQAPNDLPVHLKGGPMDTILLRLTEVLTLIGTIWWMNWVYHRLSK